MTEQREKCLEVEVEEMPVVEQKSIDVDDVEELIGLENDE